MSEVFAKKKRCKNGTRRNKKSGLCVKNESEPTKKKRCKNGTRKNKKTGNCEKYGVVLHRSTPRSLSKSNSLVKSLSKSPQQVLSKQTMKRKAKQARQAKNKNNRNDYKLTGLTTQYNFPTVY
jgi:2-oxoglutarate dehydrogenase complex dehydrogenase (E1) component-like enzyme